ncbi:MAG: hypothetical protein QM802_20880 [Agriterribacter sp.]
MKDVSKSYQREYPPDQNWNFGCYFPIEGLVQETFGNPDFLAVNFYITLKQEQLGFFFLRPDALRNIDKGTANIPLVPLQIRMDKMIDEQKWWFHDQH